MKNTFRMDRLGFCKFNFFIVCSSVKLKPNWFRSFETGIHNGRAAGETNIDNGIRYSNLGEKACTIEKYWLHNWAQLKPNWLRPCSPQNSQWEVEICENHYLVSWDGGQDNWSTIDSSWFGINNLNGGLAMASPHLLTISGDESTIWR